MNADGQTPREEHYQEVSLRAVELLAKAQRAADEAVAEAQSYARDLEESAREQYRQILQRAQSAAQQIASAEGAGSGVAPAAAAENPGALDAQKLAYVRTYARVAHAQLKSVLAALNDELDQLAEMAEGNDVPAQGPGRPEPPAPEPAAGPRAPVTWHGPKGLPATTDAVPRPSDHDTSGPGASGTPEGARMTDDESWPPIFAATNAVSYFFRESSSVDPRL